jgi:hypothetical protein
LHAIGRRGGWSLDALIQKLELPARVVASALTELELGGSICYRDFAYHPIYRKGRRLMAITTWRRMSTMSGRGRGARCTCNRPTTFPCESHPCEGKAEFIDAAA